MDSYLSGYSHNLATANQQITQHSSASASGNAGAAGASGAPAQEADISQLKAGDTFKGEIVSVNGEDVQILLTSGQYMAAKLERDVQVALGQMLNLQVQSNKDNKIVLKPVMDGSSQILKVGAFALKSANLAVNEKNLQLVSKLIENGMSIDKNTLMTFNRLALQHPDFDLSNIIKLVKLQLPVTESNLAQYENYQNLEHRLLDGIKDTSDEILKFYDTLVSSEGGTDANVTAGTLLENAGKYMEQVINLLAEGDEAQSARGDVLQNGETQGSQAPSDALNNIPQDANVQNNAAQSSQVQENTVANNAVQDAADAAGNKPTAHLTEADIRMLGSGSVQGLPDRIINLIRDSSIDLRDMNTILSDPALSKALTPEMKNEIFSSEPFKSLVKNGLQRQWTLSPQELAQEGKLQAFYEKLERQSSRLSQLMNETANASHQGNGEFQSRAVTNIRENVEFMNQMNQMYNYIQLPLRLTNSQAHGDLYIYTNKRNLARREGVLTAFLHLDMDSLGGVDVSISLQTEKNEVLTKFYLEEDSLALLEDHIDELTQRLTKKGYNCKHMIQQRDEEKTVMQHIEEQVAGGSATLSYQTFDIRT